MKNLIEMSDKFSVKGVLGYRERGEMGVNGLGGGGLIRDRGFNDSRTGWVILFRR
jgi:hypothetical protein